MLEQKARMQRKVRGKRRATDGNKDDKKRFIENPSGSEEENEYDDGDEELANAKVCRCATASAAALVAALSHNALFAARKEAEPVADETGPVQRGKRKKVVGDDDD